MKSKEKVRQQIVDSAATLFSRFGLPKTTMNDIAAASQKGKSTLYYYFRSKEEVFRAVIQKEIHGLQDAVQKAVSKEKNPQNKLRIFVKTRLAYLLEKADQYTSIREEYLVNHKFIAKDLEIYSAWEITMIEYIIQKGRNQGMFDLNETSGAARAIFLSLKGLEYPWIFNLSSAELEESVDNLLDILLAGISRPRRHKNEKVKV